MLNPNWNSNEEPNGPPALDPGTPSSLLAVVAPGSREINLEVVQESPWRVFATSVQEAFTGPRAPDSADVSGGPELRVHWIRGRTPGKPFLASCLWHVAAVLILILPIWGFLPEPDRNLAPVQIELTYIPPKELPRINLPAHIPKPPSPKAATQDSATRSEHRGADTFDPQQTILSIPVRVTHPRQTLIQPDAPPTPPKVDPQLPNIVQWTAPAPPRPQFQISPTASAPQVQRRVVRDVAVPEVPNSEKNPADLNIAASPAVNPQPQMPLSPSSAATAQRHAMQKNTSAAPEVVPSVAVEDPGLHRLIALSATPGPPAPQVSVPQGNLAARISISPEGGKPGGANTIENGSAGDRTGPGESMGASGAAPGGASNSLPAAISISGGNSRPKGGGLGGSGNSSGKLNLNPRAPMDAATTPTHRGPSVVGIIDPNLSPDKILSGKEVYTMDVNMPNLTSAAGSWVLQFAELDESEGPALTRSGKLAAPVALEKTDPKYPQDAIKQNIEGEVVLYAIIRKDGSVDSIQVVQRLDPELDKNAIEALGKWKFRPGSRDGAPVDLEAVVHIPFRYRNPNN
jgi:TonB family protein